MTRLTLLAALPIFALAACGNSDNTAVTADGSTVTPIVVTDAICRPTANGRKVSACYLNVVAAADDTLESVETPAAARASIHESKMESNMMMMHPIEGGVPLAAGQAVAFTPGGNHIMLNDVKTPLAAGDSIALTLTFAKAPDLTITVPVGQPTAADHSAHEG